MLNEYQKRGLSITLSIVEESLRDIEHILNSGDDMGILYEVRDNVPAAIKDKLLRKMALIKDRIKIVAAEFNLEKRYTEANRETFGKLVYCWKILEDAKAGKLRRYGAVKPGLEEALDPHLDMIIDYILKMEHLLRNIQK